ncbi:unnamed protein product [Ceutorhynchus assimilis]|uniref:Protein transport protein Sec24C n=1 Tax=Ceutorhynchus assimilis TaxID=467358 RepID=A0A9N9MBV2_9CUCU|nr:unnamed protein product [Ceutorhynchus assimilis]
MNPQYLPPQQGNFHPPSNGFPPRTNNPMVPNSKNGPTTTGSPNFLPPGMPPQKNIQFNDGQFVGQSQNQMPPAGLPPRDLPPTGMVPVQLNQPGMPPVQSQAPGRFPPSHSPGIPPAQPGSSQNQQGQPPRPHSQTQMGSPHNQQPPMPTGQLPPSQNQMGQFPPSQGQPPMPSQPQMGPAGQFPPSQNQQGQPSGQFPPVQAQHGPPGQFPPPQKQQPPMPPGQLPPSHNQMGQFPPSQNQQPPMPPGQLPPSQTQMGQFPPTQGQPPMHPSQAQHGPPSQFPPSQNQQPPMPASQTQMAQFPPTQRQPPMPSQSQMGPPVQFPPPQQGMFPGQNQPGIPPGPAQAILAANRMAHGLPPLPQTSNQMPPMFLNPPPPGQNYDQVTSQLQNMSMSGPHMPPPGYAQPRPQGPQMGAYPQQQQQQQKRLDPDQMPSPIQVIQDDQQNRSGPFVTNQKGLVPPLVTTNFVVQDQGNVSPRFIRSTMYNVPITQDIMKQTAVPFSLVISPMARLGKDEFAIPIINFGELGPVRCIRCKAYMCPYMQFIDSGRRFQCLFCKATTDVPAEYFQHLDHTGQRMDKFERPELVLGTYEFVATADYCRNNTLPKPPAIIFIIDVSYNNIKSGMVHLLCARMKEILQNLPLDQGQEKSNMRVGFITYNSSVHFYNIKGTLAGPQMMVVGDTQEMFMPLLDGFLCTPEESEIVIDSLMEQIPNMFADTKETEIVLLPAILAGLEALKASDSTGKLVVFHSTLPTAEAPGKLKNRDDRKLLGTDKEKTVLTPQTQAYNQLGQDCVAAGCSVDLFVFNNSFIDIATISQVARLTGGEVFKYTYFQAEIDGDRLINDIIIDISRPIAFDGIMRVRTSTGVRPTDFYGYFFMSNTTDVELASLDCDKGIAIEIKHDDKLSEEEGVYIQAALLYTSCSGQRRLRIMNLALKTCSQMADLYRSCDLDTLINFMAKQASYKLWDNSPKSVKDALVSRAAQILATYRKNCATPSSAGQLILPECMKLLPLYMNCLLKSDALSGGSDMTIDDRSFAMQAVLMMDVYTSVNYFYPRLIPLHELNEDNFEMPAPIRCTIEKMSEQGVYILENGLHMFMWVGLGASPEFVQNVFGVQSAIQIDIEKPSLPELDNPLSIAVRRIIEDIRIERHRSMRLTLVRQREKLEPVFKHFLVEDRGTDGSASYVDFLCHMHKEIRSLLS